MRDWRGGNTLAGKLSRDAKNAIQARAQAKGQRHVRLSRNVARGAATRALHMTSQRHHTAQGAATQRWAQNAAALLGAPLSIQTIAKPPSAKLP